MDRGREPTEIIAGGSSVDRPGGQNASSFLDALYSEHFHALVSWLSCVFGAGPPDPEDVAQKAFVNIAQRTQPEAIDNPKAFLWRAARNIMVSERRALVRRGELSEQLEAAFLQDEGFNIEPSRVLEARLLLNAVIKVIDAMPKQRQRVFMLHRIDGMNYSQIGRRLGMSHTAVAKHVVRAMQDIRKELKAMAALDEETDVKG